MLNPMQAWNAWARLAMQAAVTGFEAQNVMALRFMRLAAGGARAKSEASRMITEKVTALGEAQSAAVRAAIKGERATAPRPRFSASTSGACGKPQAALEVEPRNPDYFTGLDLRR